MINMKTISRQITREETLKQRLSDILLDVSWAKISKRYFGKSSSWMYHRLNGIDENGNKTDISYSERLQLRNALLDFSERIRKAAESIEI